MALQREELLLDILSQPSAPFRERHVLTTIQKVLAASKVPHFCDPIGNLIVGADSPADYRKNVARRALDPIRVFIAHTDHPGFHGVRWKTPTELEIQWHGGSPTRELEDSKVWLASAEGAVGEGILFSAELHPSGRAIQTATVRTPPECNRNFPGPAGAKKLYGGFAFRAPVWKDGELVYTKAADDLVGAFAITALALDAAKKGLWQKAKRDSFPFLGLLTRAEEVGFIGAIGHFELGWLSRARRPVLCVSLETSRTLPGAEIGKGPVVRLGDKYTVFTPGALRIFTELAEAELPGGHQRRVMDGGSCEASAATVYGLPCVGISVPLGNYHNQSLEGGPDARGSNGPAPEFVHLNDVQGLLDLCRALMKPKLPWRAPFASKRKGFKTELRKYGPLLRSGP